MDEYEEYISQNVKDKFKVYYVYLSDNELLCVESLFDIKQDLIKELLKYNWQFSHKYEATWEEQRIYYYFSNNNLERDMRKYYLNRLLND